MYKTILCIETSFNQISIAILHNKVIDQQIEICNYNHEKKILVTINTILIRNNVDIKDIEIITFSNGPGNFTSIRLGVSIAQGLSLRYNTPLIGISTLNILAEQAWRIYKSSNILVCMPTNNKKFYYWAEYKKNNKNIWLGQDTEDMININTIYKKIYVLKEKWYVIGLDINLFKKIKNNYLEFINITQSYAEDLISLTLLQNKKHQTLETVNINYLNNPQYYKYL